MIYKSKNGMPRQKIKALAYVMTREFGGLQADAAIFFGVSPGTISNWVKEYDFLRQIGDLEQELRDARYELSNYKNRLPPPDDFWEGDN